jgi:diaminopimelate decarboxylase
MITDAPFDTSLVPKALATVDCNALAEEFGTPLFVYDEDELRRRCRVYVEEFGSDGVAYAGKAFLCVAMARLVAEEGLHLDVATGGELHVALAGGFPPGRIVFHGNNKSEAELSAALDAGVGRIVADSADELDLLEHLSDKRGARPKVLARVTPGVEAHTHEFIETGTEESKFGFTVTGGIALTAARRIVESGTLHFAGLHCHIGSQIERLDAYQRAAEIVTNLAVEITRTTGAAVEALNFGGGLGARYLASDPELNLKDYAAALRTPIEHALASGALADRPRLIVEPGRSIAASAAITLYRVGTVKTVPGIGTFVAVDGGMSDNPRPVLYGAGYEAYLPAKIASDRPLRCNVVGKHCEQGDVIVSGAQLPTDVRVGDILATPTTGAYGYSMASNYNKVPRPAVVFLRGGKPRIVVRREGMEDLTRLDSR